MKRIVIFAGTTEGRELSMGFAEAGRPHIVCVATEYGKMLIKDDPMITIHKGRMDEKEMEGFIVRNADIVFDATHPYAKEVTANIKYACRNNRIEYVRVLRDAGNATLNKSKVRYFNSAEECAEALTKTQGNILLTTGSKELAKFSQSGLRERIFARVLPSAESIDLCAKAGFEGEHIIAMQGPFGLELNKALISQYDIKTLVTKESGATGGFPEKVEAALESRIDCFVIGRPVEEEGISLKEALYNYGGTPIKIALLGIGPGDEKNLTEIAREAIERADLIFGAERMIADYRESKKCYPYYLARDVAPVIKEEMPGRVAVLFSGDSGFFSGAEKMKRDLETLLKEEGVKFDIEVFSGISSLSYFASKMGISYSDAVITSIHGRSNEEESLGDLIQKIKENKKVFTLLSDSRDVSLLQTRLRDLGLEDVGFVLGCDLSYPEEAFYRFKVGDNLPELKNGLYVAFIENPMASKRSFNVAIEDEEFERGNVPMTKSAIRHLSILRLGLSQGDILYDIGSGTGSIAIQAAAMDETIKVYAIEKNEEAIKLIDKNRKKFGRNNVQIISGVAPEALTELEEPSHAFVGGSSGNLSEILECLREKNPLMRVVMNAISLETISEITAIIKKYEEEKIIEDLKIEQVSVSKAREIGRYHLMTGENPVMIVSFSFAREE